MESQNQLERLREVISENLRAQSGTKTEYISVGTAMQDARLKQNHAIFARRGCGKTLLLHNSSRTLQDGMASVYLNCEDFKKHSFPNVLIEILTSIFRELKKNVFPWFGKSGKARKEINSILTRLDELRVAADVHDAEIKKRRVHENEFGAGGGVTTPAGKVNASGKSSVLEEEESSFKIHEEKLQELDRWLPDLKRSVRDVFDASKKISTLLIQIDDLYHLRRTDQAFVVDYIHRLCKDLPLFFKIATLRHASTLYVDRGSQPIGAQERHDYQPINIDYTFDDFSKTVVQNRAILDQFGKRAGMTVAEIGDLFKGQGFARLVMAGGGVPRDVLSLFLELLNDVVVENKGKIGKDEVRLVSRGNFEHKIQELKQDSQEDQQDELIRGIYVIRKFCLTRKSNIFLVEERELQQHDNWRRLLYRLLDYRIIHSCATALTHKSADGNYRAFAVDLGCYAHMRVLQNRLTEIDVAEKTAKDLMRSAPILHLTSFEDEINSAPSNAEHMLVEPEE
ncbi:hypothetical protein [Stenotrophomonas sp. S41]|uniref:hypothetical protein n=1 Tax=Stenotrophomonas sp. S41 TaxID=2767464 RepID=UPI00190B1A68|nr:hypothetical protein [Stenotrophomonas sp. S41]MBK0011094.1 hypothetical protein [Stenotrophomonas sp. S41]